MKLLWRDAGPGSECIAGRCGMRLGGQRVTYTCLCSNAHLFFLGGGLFQALISEIHGSPDPVSQALGNKTNQHCNVFRIS